MSDIRNFLEIINDATRMDESFKDAKIKFDSQTTDDVDQYIKNFKELSKRNIIKGENKDIGKWIKARWSNFKEMVDTHSAKTTKRSTKREVKSESITVYRDDEKTVVIPLSEQASCQYGANTKWCTASTDFDNAFNDYFADNNFTIFYVMMKNGHKYAAIVYDHDGSEFYDETDTAIPFNEFYDKTEVSGEELIRWRDDNRDVMNAARKIIKDPLSRIQRNYKLYTEGQLDIDDLTGTTITSLNLMKRNNDIDVSYPMFSHDGIMVILDSIEEHLSPLIEYLDAPITVKPQLTHNYFDFFNDLSTNIQTQVIDYIQHNISSEVPVKEVLENFNELINNIGGNIQKAFILSESEGITTGTKYAILDKVNQFMENEARKLHLTLVRHEDFNEMRVGKVIDNDVYTYATKLVQYEIGDYNLQIPYTVDYDTVIEMLEAHLDDVMDGMEVY